MTTERIDIVVREDGSRVVRRNLEDIGQSADSADRSVKALNSTLSQIKGVLAGLGIGYGVSELTRYIDTWANLEGRLKLVTSSFSQLKQVQSALFEVAQRARTAYEGTADLYARIARNTQEMNATDKERLRVTENISKSLIISGSSAASANAALIQLGQGFASGTLRGEELNSVLEQTPRLAEAIANGMGKTIGQLRQMGQEGKLTSEAVFKALLSQSQAIDQEFGQMPKTIAQSFTQLSNELMRFIGEAGQANGVANNLATAIQFVAKNLDILFAILQGYAALKLSEIFLSTTASIYRKVQAVIADTAAVTAQRTATIAQAQAEQVAAAETIAQTQATLANIVATREVAVVQLAAANANINTAKAAIAAAEAAGAQSFALRTLKLATQELAAAEAARAGALGTLAALGQAQARVSAQLTAATAAEAAATAGLGAARTAATGAASLAARALGFLGGPIGAITTLLGLGVTAWQLWGNKAQEVEKEVEQTLYQKTDTFIANMDKQIAKLKERNRLMGVDPTVGKSTAPGADELRDILTEIDRVGKDTNLNDVARTEILKVLGGRYNEVTQRMKEYKEQNDKVNETTKAEKMEAWLSKNKEYLSKTEQLALAIKDAKKELGNAFTPEIEAKITEHFKKKDKSGQHDSLLAYKASIAELEQQQKLETEMMRGTLRDNESLYQQGAISFQKYTQTKLDAKLEENDRMQAYVQAELDATKGMGQEQIAARKRYQGELKVLSQERINIEKETNNQINEYYADIDKRNDERNRQELENIYMQTQNVQDKIRMYEMLPAAITDVVIADLQEQQAALEGVFADEKKIESIKAKIAALQQLRNVQSISEKQDFDYAMARNIGNEWKRTGDIIANSLSSAFGKGGQALSKMVQGYTGWKKAEVDLKRQYDERVKVADKDAKRIRDAEIEYATESAQARMGAFADMAGAAKSYFSEHTAAYKVLEAAERGYRAIELALAVQNMAQKLGLITATTTAQVAGNTAVAASATVSAGVVTAANTAIGTSAAAAGVATQALGDPYTAWARMAAMAAVMVGLGFAVSAGGAKKPSTSSAEYVQKYQGTGSVFGDTDAKSNSIKNAIERLEDNSDLMLPLTQGMLYALKNIEASMTGLTNLVVRSNGLTDGSNLGIQTGKLSSGPGGLLGTVTNITTKLASAIPVVGGLLSGVLGKVASLWGSTKQNITDAGLMFGGSVSALQQGQGFSQYANIETTKKSWFGLKKSTSNSIQTQGLDAELSQQFGLIFSNLEVALKAAGTGLGKTADDVASVIDNLTLQSTKVSLKGLSGEELTKALNAVISKSMDEIAQAVFPGLDAFRKVGEGYAETALRVSSGVEVAKQALDQFGISAINYADVVNKQGDVATEIIRQSIQGVEQAGSGIRKVVDIFTGTAQELVETYQTLTTLRQQLNNAGLNGANTSLATIQGAGGLDNLRDGLQDFLENFYTESERSAMKLKDLNAEFQRLGIAMPATKDEFKELIKRFDDGTESGAKLVGKMLSLSGAFAEAADAAESVAKAALEAAQDLAKQRGAMQAQLLELQGRKSEALALRRRMELEAMDASLRPLQQQIYAMEDVADARDKLTEAYERESATLQGTIDKFKDLAKSLREYSNGLLTGDMSVLSPEDKYKAAKAQFDKTYALAKSGDPEAMAQLQSVSDQFLEASKGYYATSQQYTTDFNYVRKALENTAKAADTQANMAQAQLNAMNQMVAGIIQVNGSVMTVAQALAGLGAAMAGAAGGSGGGGGVGGSSGAAAPAGQGGYRLVGNTLYFPGGGSHNVQGAMGASLLMSTYGLVANGDGTYTRTRAMGGYTPPGRVLVGEYGPEVVDFDRPGMVYDAEDTRMMHSGGSDNSALVKAVEEMQAAVVRELQAANAQRGAAAVAQIERIAELVDSVDTNTRTMERNAG